MNTVTITVKSVNIVKTGVDKNGKPWTLLNVIDENDKKYSTFDEEYMKAVGKTITFSYEEKESGSNPKNGGKPYKNRNIVDQKKQSSATPSATTAWAEKLVAKVKELEARIVKLETFTGADQADEVPPLDHPF